MRFFEATKTTLSILLIVLLSLTAANCNIGSDSKKKDQEPTEDTLKILFIGNSLTRTNDMPLMMEEMAQKAGKDIFVDMRTVGGSTLLFHSSDSLSLQKIRERKWDYVVLQSNANTAFPELYQKEIDMFNTMIAIIKENHADTKIVYFLITGRQMGVTFEGPNGEEIYYTYAELQEKIITGSLHVAKAVNAIIAPVGAAWLHVLQENPEFTLHSLDGIHPALRGSYLGACVFYATLFRESPGGIDYYSDLNESDAKYLQNVAGMIVLDDLEKWLIPPLQ